MHCVLQPSRVVSCRHVLCPAVSCIVFYSHHALCSAVTMHCILQYHWLCSAVVMHYVLQSLWFMFGCHKLFCGHYELCSADLWTVFCRVVALLSTTVTVWTLQSLYQFLILLKLKRCRHLCVRDTEAQPVSDSVFDTSPGGRHRTRIFHLGGHLVVTKVWSCVRLIGLPLVNGLPRGDFSGSVCPFGAKSGFADGPDYCECQALIGSCFHQTVCAE